MNGKKAILSVWLGSTDQLTNYYVNISTYKSSLLQIQRMAE